MVSSKRALTLSRRLAPRSLSKSAASLKLCGEYPLSKRSDSWLLKDERDSLPRNQIRHFLTSATLRSGSQPIVPEKPWIHDMPLPKSEYLSETWKDGLFDDKVVFCTGGAGTICSAQVRALVHLGANACIVGRNVEKTEGMAKDIATARKGAKVLGFGGVDVRKPEALEEAAKRCAESLGGIDFVIAGAAGNFLAPISQLSPNAFKAVMDIDILGSYNTLKATVDYLLESVQKHKPATPAHSATRSSFPTGRIIFVSATLHYTGLPMQTHVSAAKAGIDALSASVGIEYGPRGLTSNIIAPGPIAGTEGMDRLATAGGMEKASKGVPIGRLGTVRDIADATVFLFSEAGGFVNAEVLVGEYCIPLRLHLILFYSTMCYDLSIFVLRFSFNLLLLLSGLGTEVSVKSALT
ncbi:NAD(P)-binding protein [Viridothelium virens]|uniref:2,4-dienoyl-CoA reductase [(3E)-enoyl-CoA-producing] n=1 Tax=Viridothelium virens TaxID=1048519 RepID=A0A6A6HE29_VIRVR|nr:NAD(P)-binding protein [Viridothelium virens]